MDIQIKVGPSWTNPDWLDMQIMQDMYVNRDYILATFGEYVEPSVFDTHRDLALAGF